VSTFRNCLTQSQICRSLSQRHSWLNSERFAQGATSAKPHVCPKCMRVPTAYFASSNRASGAVDNIMSRLNNYCRKVVWRFEAVMLLCPTSSVCQISVKTNVGRLSSSRCQTVRLCIGKTAAAAALDSHLVVH